MTVSNFNIINSNNPQWDEILRSAGKYDFYHLSAYHRIAEKRDGGKAIMIYYSEDNFSVIFPLLIRDIAISPLIATDGWKDATSVYGYTGPVMYGDITLKSVGNFIKKLTEYCAEQGIITIFSRLNPIIQDIYNFYNYGQILPVENTLSIDLTMTDEERLASFRYNHRRTIKTLRKEGFQCHEVGYEYLKDFIRIYHETMDRVNAKPYFYYSTEYFNALMTDLPDIMQIFICEYNNVIVSSTLFSYCNNISQFFLSGTLNDYLKYSPTTLMIDEGCKWAINKGAKIMHLGGGLKPLYQYKDGFASNHHHLNGWGYVANEDIYQKINTGITAATGINPENPYFPYYRNPAFGI